MKKIVAVTALITLILIPGFLKSHSGHRKAMQKHAHSHDGHMAVPDDDHMAVPDDDHMATPKDGHPETVLYKRVIKWLGNFHPVAIHFPIALIIMTGISELLFFRLSSPIYQYSSRFMIIGAAIFAIPAVFLGLAFGFEADYSGALEDVFWWHRFSGISTAILANITAVLRELCYRKNLINTGWYYGSLYSSVALVLITGYLGGEMTFGLFHMFP